MPLPVVACVMCTAAQPPPNEQRRADSQPMNPGNVEPEQALPTTPEPIANPHAIEAAIDPALSLMPLSLFVSRRESTGAPLRPSPLSTGPERPILP